MSTLQTRDKEIENLRQLLRNIPGTAASKQKGSRSPVTTASSSSTIEKTTTAPEKVPKSTIAANPPGKTSKFLAPTTTKSSRATVTSKIDTYDLFLNCFHQKFVEIVLLDQEHRVS